MDLDLKHAKFTTKLGVSNIDNQITREGTIVCVQRGTVPRAPETSNALIALDDIRFLSAPKATSFLHEI